MKRWVLAFVTLCLVAAAPVHHKNWHQDQTLWNVYGAVHCEDIDEYIAKIESKLNWSIMLDGWIDPPTDKELQDLQWFKYVRRQLCKEI